MKQQITDKHRCFQIMHILPCKSQEKWRRAFTETKNKELPFKNEWLGICTWRYLKLN